MEYIMASAVLLRLGIEIFILMLVAAGLSYILYTFDGFKKYFNLLGGKDNDNDE